MSRQPGTHRPDRQRLIPLWRNERLPGTQITLPGALRAVLVTVVLMAAVMAAGLWRVVDLTGSNANLIKQVKDTQESYHASRLEFEAKIKAANAYTQAQVRALACSVVAFTPPARSNAFVRSLAVSYRCPPYRAPSTAPALYAPPRAGTVTLSPAGTQDSSAGIQNPSVPPDSVPHPASPSPVTGPSAAPTAISASPIRVCLIPPVCLR